MTDHTRHEGDKGEYEFPLASFMEIMLGRWGMDRETFWTTEGGPVDIDSAKEADHAIFELASEIYNASQKPINSDDIRNALGQIDFDNFPRQTSDILDSYVFLYLWEHLEEYLAGESIDNWERAASNMLGFFALFLKCENVELSEPVSVFMKLVIRNYVWGFEPECVILCRSAMEAAFRKMVTLEMLEHHLGSRANRDYTLIDAICTAKKEGMINEELVEKAHAIRLRANKAIHYDPYATKNVFGTMSDTLDVILALSC